MLPAPVPTPSASKILIFDTHPVQYRSPVFRELSRRNPSHKIYLFNSEWCEPKWGLKERGQIPRQNWNLNLLEGFSHEILETARLGKLETMVRLRRVLVEEKPTAILLFGYYSWENWMLLFLARTLGIRTMFLGDTFNDGFEKKRSGVKSQLVRLFFSQISSFIAVGEKNFRYYLAKGVERKKIVIGKHCVDDRFFATDEEQGNRIRREWRAKMGIAESATVMLFLGRLVERKRPWDVVAIHNQVGTAELFTVVAGNGVLEESLRPSATSSLRFIGFQDQHEARKCYYGADFLIVPSEWETWGLVVNEAFLCGLPALVTETCGCAGDLVVPGETGEIFTPGDVPGASRIIQGWLNEPSQLKALGRQAKRKVLKEFSVDRFVDAIEAAELKKGHPEGALF